MTKLRWKKKYLNDKSGYWFEADVGIIKWKYIVESLYMTEKYVCFLWLSNSDDEVKISKKLFKKVEDAQYFCENHLENTAKKLNSFLKNG